MIEAAIKEVAGVVSYLTRQVVRRIVYVKPVKNGVIGSCNNLCSRL